MQTPARNVTLLGVVLCAGGSSRMGRPKGLLELCGRPLVAHHVAALRTICDSVTVVLGADAAAHARALPPAVRVVVNERWAKTWPADSLALALEDPPATALVTPVDVPPATADTLSALLAAGAPAVPVGPNGASGHPVLLSAPQIAAVRRGSLPEGLRSVVRDAARVAVTDPLVGVDFDDPASWERLRPMMERGGG